MASATQVFAVPELLEMILLRLPERDLLLSQRVNTTWRNLTKTSPHIQRKLFYKAEVCDPASTTDLVWNPLLKFTLTTGGGLSSSKPETKITKTSWNNMFLTQPATSEVHVELPLYLDFLGDGEQPLGSEIPSLQEQTMEAVKNPNGVTMEDVRSTGWIKQEVVKLSRLGYNYILVCFAVCDVSVGYEFIEHIGNPSDYASLHGGSLWMQETACYQLNHGSTQFPQRRHHPRS